jgi:hypothetical protein
MARKPPSLKPWIFILLTLILCLTALIYISYARASLTIESMLRSSDQVVYGRPAWFPGQGPGWKITASPHDSTNAYVFDVPLHGDLPYYNQYVLADCCFDAKAWPMTSETYTITAACIAEALGMPESFVQESIKLRGMRMYLAAHGNDQYALIYLYSDQRVQRQNMALSQLNTISLKPNTVRGDLAGIDVGDFCFLDKLENPHYVIFARGNVMISVTYPAQPEKLLEKARALDRCLLSAKSGQ